MTDSTKCYKFAPISPPVPSSSPSIFPSLRMERIPSSDSAGPAAMLSHSTDRWEVTSRLRPWGPPADSAAGSQTREEALNSGTQSLATLGPKGGLRSLVLSWALSLASLRLILLLTAGGLDPAASPSHCTTESSHPDLTPDPNNEPLAPTAAAAAAGQATRPRCPSPPTLDPPQGWTAEKRFYGNLSGITWGSPTANRVSAPPHPAF